MAYQHPVTGVVRGVARRAPRRSPWVEHAIAHKRGSAAVVPLGDWTGGAYDQLEGFSLKGLVKGIGKIGTNIGKTVKKAVRDTSKQAVRTGKQVAAVAKKVAPYALGAGALVLGGPALLAGGKKLGGLIEKGAAGLFHLGKKAAPKMPAPQALPQLPGPPGGGPVSLVPAVDAAAPPMFDSGTSAPVSGGGGGGGFDAGSGGGFMPAGAPADAMTPPTMAGAGSMWPLLALGGAALYVLFLSGRRR